MANASTKLWLGNQEAFSGSYFIIEKPNKNQEPIKTIRRLTPLECERLQGLPDNYTAYGTDANRYRAIGNGMAQPCADFILSKVVEMNNTNKE